MHGWYINLDHRTDRDGHMREDVLSLPLFSRLRRFPAIRHEDGAVGCALSHIGILRDFLDQAEGEDLVVMEDDFTILDRSAFDSFAGAFSSIRGSAGWDVVVLTPRGETIAGSPEMEERGFRRIRDHQTATGYVVKRAFVPVLLANFEEGLAGLSAGGCPNRFALDQHWKRLQDDHRFYFYEKIYGGQLVGYSDIEKRDVDYNARFLEQK